MDMENDLIKHIAVSAALPEVFYNFRVFTKKNCFIKTDKELEAELKIYEDNLNDFDGTFFLNNWKINKWHFERMIKMYRELSLKGNLKCDFKEILDRLENKHFEKAEIFAKELYKLILREKIVFSDFYDEENYLFLNLEMFVLDDCVRWEEIIECVSIVTIALDNLHLTHLISQPKKTKLNIINLEKIEKEKNKVKDLIEFYSLKTSLKIGKERGTFTNSITKNKKKEQEFNWDLLYHEIEINGLRNLISFNYNSNNDNDNERGKEKEKEKDVNVELDYYFSQPKKLACIEEEEMAPVIKGMQGAREMCPICFSLNMSYISGCMCCNDCGWSACSLS